MYKLPFDTKLADANPSLVRIGEYVNNSEPVRVRCTVCQHEWLARPANLTRSTRPTGCPVCNKNHLVSHAQLVARLGTKRPDVTVLGTFTKGDTHIRVRHNCGNEYDARIDWLLASASGDKCNACKYVGSQDERIEEAAQRFNTLVTQRKELKLVGSYTGKLKPVEAVCIVHGTSCEVVPETYRYHGTYSCAQCNKSKTSRCEQELYQFVKSIAPDAVNRQAGLFELARRLELDVYVPSMRFGVEYHGLYWHSDSLGSRDTRHYDKWKLCQAAGIRLFTVYEDDWINRRSVVEKTLLLHQLGKSDRIYARSTTIRVSESIRVVREFYNCNHLLGSPNSGKSYGLFERGSQKACAVMTFSQALSRRGVRSLETDEWELVRFAATKCVVGGASKLLSAFIKDHPSATITSYSENEFFTGELYAVLGFKHEADLRPDYKVFSPSWGLRRWHKKHVTRSALARYLGDDFDASKSERENCLSNRIYRIYDCGKKRWVYKPL